MRPISLNTLAKLLDCSHPSQRVVKGFAIDSRKVMQGDLFFALPGNRVDGHQFLKEVAIKGASAAVVSKNYRGEAGDLPLLTVPDVVLSLQDLARKILQQRKSRVIAITGSLGKTTTKEFAKALLSPAFPVFSSPLSYNSQVTLPLSILLAEGEEEYLILEMGMTEPGQIEKLVSIAPPDIALITSIAIQHANHFQDGVLGIGREKASLFSHSHTSLGILNLDLPHFATVATVGSCLKKTFSVRNQRADYFLEKTPDGVRVFIEGSFFGDFNLDLALPVHYQNFLAALAIAHTVGVPTPLLQEIAPSLKLPPMRFEQVEKQGIVFINDAYNANPDSMKAALYALPNPQPKGKKIAVLSEMDALGVYSEQSHEEIAYEALQKVDYLLCLGSRCVIMEEVWKKANKPVEHFHSRGDLGKRLKEVAQPGDIVLLKGARAYALDLILNLF